MDEDLVGMIRDNFKQLHDICQGIGEKIDTHIEKDEVYWKKLDQQEGQISLLKVIGSAAAGGFAAWEGLKHLWR
jgi:hypothetical protein